MQGQPSQRRRVYVCVGRRPAATVFLAKHPPRTALAGFGPVPAGLKVREAVRRLNGLVSLTRLFPGAEDDFFRSAGIVQSAVDARLHPP